MKRLYAYLLGVIDGWRQPHDLTMGLTWDNDDARSNAHDVGANHGQALGLRVGR